MIKLSGLAAELFGEIKKLTVMDCHEHLPAEKERTSRKIDVTTLFSHYCKADLEAAGLLQGAPQTEVFDTTKPLLPRWRKFKPYFEAIRYGSYAYPAFAYVRDILGFDDISDETVEAISARMQADNRPGIYKKLMQETCNIEKAIQCLQGVEKGDQPFFVYLFRDKAFNICSRGALESLEELTDHSIHTLADCVAALQEFAEQQKKEGAVGLKIGAAYGRTLHFPEVPAGAADKVFCQLRAGVRSQVSIADQEILENYLLRREIEACVELEVPIVIHTGFQAGNKNDIRNTRATHLWPLLRDYPKARFDLFHGSFPYVSDMTVLGKYFENVSLNMCWMHIMGPEISRRALREWLDAVPVTKIFAFGGDYGTVEKVYGHLQLARANVAAVLAERVENGGMKEAQALEVARLLFYDNPKRWYKL